MMSANKDTQKSIAEFTSKTFEVQRKNMGNFSVIILDDVLSSQHHAFVWTYIQKMLLQKEYQTSPIVYNFLFKNSRNAILRNVI